METYFDRIVVINLRRRPDRLKVLQKELADKWIFQSPDVFQAVDASKLPIPINWHWGTGAWGCLKSHEQVLQQALEDGIQRLLILEDDLVLSADFATRCETFLQNVPDDWEQLMLGGQHILPPKPFADGVVRCMNTHRTHAYAVQGEFIGTLYREFAACSGHCDQVMAIMQPAYRVYAPEPFLCGQRASPSDICGRWNPTTFWTGAIEPVGPLSRTQMLLFELGRECNLGKCHAKCPNMHPDRLSGLDCRKELDDETIIQAAIAAHKAHGFAGLVGWHYYNEPTLQGERMLHLMDAISESVPDARYILWTNNTNPEWIAENRNRFAWISYSNYAGDPLGLQLDNRLERMPTRYPEPCLRPFTEMICDCYGNHHACCQDWRGESSLGNIMVEGFSTIVGKWEQLQTSVCGKAMTDDAPEGCKQCGHRPDAGCFDRPSLIRALRWRDGK